MRVVITMLLAGHLLIISGCSSKKDNANEALDRFEVPQEQLSLARRYIETAGLCQRDTTTNQIHGGEAFLIFPADPEPRLNVTVPIGKARPRRPYWPLEARGSVAMRGPIGSERDDLVCSGRILFCVARNKKGKPPGAVVVRSFAAVPRKSAPSLIECLALAHRDITAEQLDTGSFELNLLLEPSATGEYSVFIYLGHPMKEDVFWEGWNRVKNDRGPNPVRLGEDHQGLSNLVEVKVVVKPAN